MLTITTNISFVCLFCFYQTSKDFEARLNRKIKKAAADTSGYPEAPLAYDAVWALALALNK